MRVVLSEMVRRMIFRKAERCFGYDMMEISNGEFLVFTGRGAHRVSVHLVGNELDVFCECKDFRYGERICRHIAYVLNNKYDPYSCRFDIPKLSEYLDKVV
jgi:hypothetical protein